MKKVSEYFEQYPQRKVCFQTSDGLLFHEEGDAKLHANSLENKEVESHKRPIEKAEDKTEATAASKAAKK